MDMLEIRDAIVQHMENEWAPNVVACPVFYVRQFGEIDLEQVTGDYFIKFYVDFQDADQANIHPSPFHRTSGNIEILLFGKESASERTRLGYLDTLTGLFKLKVLGTGCHTKVPRPGRSEEHDGWCSKTLLVPFFADSNS